MRDETEVIQVVLTRGFVDWHETVLGLLSAIVGISFFGEGFVAGLLPLGDVRAYWMQCNLRAALDRSALETSGNRIPQAKTALHSEFAGVFVKMSK